jgi:protocatechuate 3,4-dioxygenase beta subunit
MSTKPKIFQISLTLILFALTSCYSQTDTKIKLASSNIVGGGCEGCEGVFEFGNKTLTPFDTLPLFEESELKLKITGTVFKKDGKTPAKDVILYIYHTNREGIYQTKGDENGWAKRHGFIRGWIKTSNNGAYTFYTFRPAAYPNRTEPEHIHLTVKEFDKNEYYLDSYFFDDDPLLSWEKRRKLNNRGGSGIMMPVIKNGLVFIHRDIILGLNIPDYD